MAMTLTKAADERDEARHRAEDWVRHVMARKVEVSLVRHERRIDEDTPLYRMVGECLHFLGQEGMLDEAKRFIEALEAYEEAAANYVVAYAADLPTELEQMHEEAEDVPDYFSEP